MAKPLKISRSKRNKKRKIDYAITTIIIIVLAVPITFLIQSKWFKGYVVASEYMKNSLFMGDFVMVKHAKPDDTFEVDDIIIFKYPPEKSRYRFGRIVATGGQIVQIYKKNLYVNNIETADPFSVIFKSREVDASFLSLRDYFGPFDVPEGCYFILGDNRDISIDSRNWGELMHDNIIGKPLFVYFSWKPESNASMKGSKQDILQSIIYNIGHFVERINFDRIGTRVNAK